jgi:hypothetical protein
MRRLLDTLWLGLLIALGGAVGLAGCEDDLPKASLITHMRVLGARTEVVGDEQRSTPRPGERAILTWAIAYPEYRSNDDEIESLFVVCTAPSRFTGTPVCQELINAAQSGSTPIGVSNIFRMSCADDPDALVRLGGISFSCHTGTPRLEIDVDDGYEASAKLVQGIVCRNGTPRADMNSAIGVSCEPNPGADEDELDSIPVYGTVPVAQKASEENLNPDLDRLELRLRVEYSDEDRGELWTAVPPEELPDLEDDCTQNSAIRPRDVNRELIALRYPFERGDEDEVLQFSAFATLGELSRRFTVLEPDARKRDDPPDENEEIEWVLSKEERADLSGSAKLVRFYFSVLDGRGGFDVTTRELCVSRP